MTLAEFGRELDPKETVLLLGAGASVPSGGRTGQGLADFLCQEMSGGEIESDDLSEAASLLEDRFGRTALIETLAKDLTQLKPDNGLLSLMSLEWARAYTTNFDQLVERACKQVSRQLRVIRTNSDFGALDSGGFELLKIHGCITRDRGLGHTDSMILTERDYTEFDTYREGLFAKLQFDLHTKNVLVIGHSLKDRHLRDLIDRIAEIAKARGTSNRIFVLVLSSDPGRMRLLQERNLRVASGSMAQLVEAFQTAGSPTPKATDGASHRGPLPQLLLNRTVNVDSAVAMPPNAARMFSGGAAAYADVANGLTFERTFEIDAVEHLFHAKIQYLTITGASGVGKTTAARRIMREMQQHGHACYEHVDEFPLDAGQWFRVAQTAHAASKRVFLMIDDAPRHLNGVNRLANRLADENIDSLSLVLTAHSSAWEQRSRTGVLRRLGKQERLELLDDREVDALVSLIRTKDEIRSLLEPGVAGMTAGEQVNLVRKKSTSDMFVALKYLFASDGLDEIVLAEYAQLDEDVQEVYKVASLLEATYAHASRQLILEVLNLNWSDISLVLDRTKGVLKQKEVDRREGHYVWRTRHPVIAQVIAKYKYIDQDELYFMLKKIVGLLNSAMLLDRNVVPNLCDNEWGIGRLTDVDRQAKLLELLATRSGNRVPWHRLIALWLDRDLMTAEGVIKRAISSVGFDSPIARYQVRLTLLKAEKLKKLGTDDYLALIFEAETKAKDTIDGWPLNKYSYLSLMDVGEALLNATGSVRILEESVEHFDAIYDEILDDQILRWRQRAVSLIGSRK